MIHFELIKIEQVLNIHQMIIKNDLGLKGNPDLGKLAGALSRIESHIHYTNLHDVFEIGSLYAFALAKSHAFPDGNKRAALVIMLTFLLKQGIKIPNYLPLDDIMVDVASDKINSQELANYLRENAIFIE